jgi:flavin-dependent thymidylate synthase
MDVKLISFTGKGAPDEQWAAADLLLFTKSTRLEMRPNLLESIKAMPIDKKLAELEYMSRTIPSSWEFVDYTFLVTGVSRAYTHQQVRTRAASYAQQSMRVVNVSDFDYIFTDRNKQSLTAMHILNSALGAIKQAYAELLTEGQAVEDARGILPTNIATNIVCKFNMRTFVDLAKARTGGRTQNEYQCVVGKMVDEVLAVHPWMDKFLHGDVGRNYFDEIEAFAAEQFGGDLITKGKLLKIVDGMRKGAR